MNGVAIARSSTKYENLRRCHETSATRTDDVSFSSAVWLVDNATGN